MPVPKRKTSKRRRDQRSANKGLKPKAITGCQTCQEPIMPHTACKQCGYYKGVKILRTKQDRMFARGKQRDAFEATSRAKAAVQEPSVADKKSEPDKK